MDLSQRTTRAWWWYFIWNIKKLDSCHCLYDLLKLLVVCYRLVLWYYCFSVWIFQCDDETCKHTTRSLNLRLIRDAERGTVCPEYPRCNGRLVRKVCFLFSMSCYIFGNSPNGLIFHLCAPILHFQYSEADLYKQLTYFSHVLDTVHCIDKVFDNFFL